MKYDNLQDKDDLTVQLFNHNRKLVDDVYKEYKHQKELLEMEERLYQRLMKAMSVDVLDNASPAIKEIKKQLNDLGNK